MGNRAVITLDETPTENSVGIYLHWNGGAESVLGFVTAAQSLGCRSSVSDKPYALARLVQIIGNFFGGTTSIGVGKLRELDCDNGDNGLFSAQWTNDSITLRNQRREGEKMLPVDIEQIKKQDPYWNPKPGDTSIVDSVLEKNLAHFAKEMA